MERCRSRYSSLSADSGLQMHADISVKCAMYRRSTVIESQGCGMFTLCYCSLPHSDAVDNASCFLLNVKKSL